MTSRLAMITFFDEGYPTHPIAPGGQPPGIWPSPGHPAHPIAPGGQPPGIWGGAPPWVDNTLPGQPPGIWPSPGHPDQGLPGGGTMPPRPTHPIVIPPGSLAPGIPSHPIYWPPYPSQGPGFPTHPIAPGGGGAPPKPEHPIIIPGDDERNPRFEVKTGWSPQTGWVVVIVPTEDALVPTPSKANPSKPTP